MDFFFVLSGFIIFWAHKKDIASSANAKIYLTKRLFRIYPPFILISIVVAFATLGGIVYYTAWERPVLKYLNKKVNRK